MKEEYSYLVRYKLFSDSNYVEFKFEESYDDLKSLIYQLGKGLARINGKLIKGFPVIEDIQILEQNFDEEQNGKHYDHIKLDIEESKQLGNYGDYFPMCLEDNEPGFEAHNKDITNQIFRECNISIDSLYNSKGIRIEEGILIVSGVTFNIEKSTKLYELLDMILRLKYYHHDTPITYEIIKNYYMTNNFNELKVNDITHTRVRDILKSKMENVRDSLGLKELPISAQKSGIVFRIF